MMKKRWKITGINFDHMHMGDLLRMGYFMKSPPQQFPDHQARALVEDFIAGR